MAVKDIDYEFVNDPTEELTCSICMKVLCEPHLMNCCGQQFCEHCLEKWLLKNKTCPHCRSTNFSHIFMQPTNRKTRELKVYCPNKQHGCKEVLKIREYEQHLSTTNDKGCLYVILKCPNNCAAEIFRGDMEAHTQKECPRHIVSCSHCKLQGEHQHIAGDHVDECPLYPLPCPRGCEDTVLRKDLKAHRDTCPLEPVLCPFHELGCSAEVCRKDLAKHVETTALQHMTVLAKSHMKLQAEHATLTAKFSALREDYTALQESCSAKFKVIVPVIKSLPHSPDRFKLAQISTILDDPSCVKIGDSVDLVLFQSSERSGHHHFVYTHQEPQLELKFILEWERVTDQSPPLLHHKFKLYSITDLSARTCGLSFDVQLINLNLSGRSEGWGNRLSSVCCGEPWDVMPSNGSRHLIGVVSLDLDPSCKQVTISFTDTSVMCGCSCHRTPLSRIPPPPTMYVDGRSVS